LAKETFKILSKSESKTFLIPIDDYLNGSYSHTAILANELKKYGYTPLYNRLHAKNRVSYSGKPLSFRLANPRDFEYRGPSSISVILVDDIVTTGTTLQEAQKCLKEYSVNVDFAFVLADVKLERSV
jgi:competence protein ComFC